MARRPEGEGRIRPWRGRRHPLQVRPAAYRARPRRRTRRLPVPQRGPRRADPVRAGDTPPRLPGQPHDGELPDPDPRRRAGGHRALPHGLRARRRPRQSHQSLKGSNMTEDTTKTALITGASRGLGLALARRLAAEGWTLIIDARGAEDLEAARVELADFTHVVAIPGDVTDDEHRRSLAGAVRELGGLDALVNNASILGPSPQPVLLDYPLEVLEEVYRTNVVSPLALIQALRTELRTDARIINVTSDAAVEPYEGWGGYGSSKAALEQLSNILAAENPNLRVYSVDPGDMRTRMQQEAFPDEDISDRPLPEESVPGFLELIAGDLPSGRYEARALTASTSIRD